MTKSTAEQNTSFKTGFRLGLFLLSLLSASPARAAWSGVNSSTNSNLDSVYFIDANTGWVCGQNGAILKTIDGGTSWSSQNSGTIGYLSDIRFIDSSTGIAVGALGGFVLRTTDGGTTWAAVSNGGSFNINSVFWASSTNVWTGGGGGEIRKSTDSGLTWSNGDPGGGAGGKTINNLFFLNSSTGWASATSGTILKTVDGGATWNPISVGAGLSVQSIFFINSSTGWAVDGTNVFKSTDGGNGWKTQYSSPAASLMSINFVNETKGWIAGSNLSGGVIFVSTDSGESFSVDFTTASSFSLNTLSKIFFPTSSIGFAVGAGGMILKNAPAAAITSAAPTTLGGALTALNNVFDPGLGESTTIKYFLNNGGPTAIRIYSMQGRLIKTLLQDVRDPGTYQDVSWDGRNEDGETVASGIYLVHIQAPGFSYSQKIAVVR